MAARIKSAYAEVKPQFEELKGKYAAFESISDRFQSADELQPLIELNDSLFGDFERDDNGQLVPAVSKAADLLFQRDPQRAGYLWAESAERQVSHPTTGQPTTLIKLALEGMRDDPDQRAEALALLGGVEPSAQAPTWAPTTEQLAVVKPELQDTFRSLPYDEREDLSANTPEFINRYLSNQKFQQELIAENQKAQALQSQQQQQREVQQRQEAEQAGYQYVEQGFRDGFTKFANSIVGRSQFIQPLSAEQAEAQGLAPEQAQQFNAQANQVNQGVGTFIALVTATLSHPDLKWMATDVLKGLGVQNETLNTFDKARQEYAGNARNYGELAHQKRDGSGLLTNANRAMSRMIGQGNLVAQPLFQLFSQLFELKAHTYNATVNSGPQVRPSVNGNGYDPTTATPTNLPTGKLSRAEIDRMYG